MQQTPPGRTKTPDSTTSSCLIEEVCGWLDDSFIICFFLFSYPPTHPPTYLRLRIPNDRGG